MNALEILGTLSLGYLVLGSLTAILSKNEPEEEDGWLEHMTVVFVILVAWPIVWSAGISAGVREVFKETEPRRDDPR